MKAIVSLSGGRDSATCLGLAVQKYGKENVYAIGFEYGSKHPQELEAAKKIAAYYDVPYQIITINPSIFQGSTSTLLAGSKGEVEKDKTYEEILKERPGVVDTYVPARNTLFGAYILARAESLSQEFNDKVTIILGQHADDSGFTVNDKGEQVLDASKAAYPDCSIEYVKAFKKVAKISSSGRVRYWAPFIKCHKWELIKTGMQLKKPVPYELCMSCYDPVQAPDGTWHECGHCATCLDVQKAMKLANEAVEKEKAQNGNN
jgi:7-cyano-7-deazaguanine synthase